MRICLKGHNLRATLGPWQRGSVYCRSAVRVCTYTSLEYVHHCPCTCASLGCAVQPTPNTRLAKCVRAQQLEVVASACKTPLARTETSSHQCGSPNSMGRCIVRPRAASPAARPGARFERNSDKRSTTLTSGKFTAISYHRPPHRASKYKQALALSAPGFDRETKR